MEVTMKAEVFGKSWCAYCNRAKELLDERKIEYVYRDIEKEPGALEEMRRRAPITAKTVPQVFLDDSYVGGYDALRARLKESK
jgi:glutaredoxin